MQCNEEKRLNYNKIDNKSIKIFRLSKAEKYFYLNINEDFYFIDTSQISPIGTPGVLIKEYFTKDSIINIYIKINGKDSLLKFNTTLFDSILIGTYSGQLEGKLYIKTEKDYGPWLTD
jgi:hypothetical protein